MILSFWKMFDIGIFIRTLVKLSDWLTVFCSNNSIPNTKRPFFYRAEKKFGSISGVHLKLFSKVGRNPIIEGPPQIAYCTMNELSVHQRWISKSVCLRNQVYWRKMKRVTRALLLYERLDKYCFRKEYQRVSIKAIYQTNLITG